MTTTGQRSGSRGRPPRRTDRQRQAARERRATRHAGRAAEPGRESGTGKGISRGKAMRRRWIALLCVLTVVGVGYLLLFTSLLGVRSVEVVGARDVPVERITDVAKVPQRRAMLRVDTDGIARRVATLPGVATVDVSRSWPSTIEIAITERTPLGYYDTGKQLFLVDVGGVVYKKVDRKPQGLPEFKLGEVGPGNPQTRAVVKVLKSLPQQLRERVTILRAKTAGSVEFTLRGGKIVRWGGAGNNHRKSEVLAALMTRPGHIYDVSSPELPTIS